jgi:hypothetical protein
LNEIWILNSFEFAAQDPLVSLSLHNHRLLSSLPHAVHNRATTATIASPHSRRPHRDTVAVSPLVPTPQQLLHPLPLSLLIHCVSKPWVEVVVEHSSPSLSFVRMKLTQPSLRTTSSQPVNALLSTPNAGDRAPALKSKSPPSDEHRLGLVSIRFHQASPPPYFPRAAGVDHHRHRPPHRLTVDKTLPHRTAPATPLMPRHLGGCLPPRACPTQPPPLPCARAIAETTPHRRLCR